MTDQPSGQPIQNQGQGSVPASLAEIDFLKGSGEDVSDLMPDLEAAIAALRSDREQRQEPAPTHAPQTQADYENLRLPINEKGEAVQLDPQIKPTTQDAALDPYKVDVPRSKPEDTGDGQKTEEYEPGEMLVDSEGKLRDAKTGRYVPHQALHAERVRRKEIETEAQRLRDENARAQERLNMLTEIMQSHQDAQNKAANPNPDPAQADVDIDPEQDIFGAHSQLKKRYDSLVEEVRSLKKDTTQQTEAMRMTEQFRQDATRFMAEKEDFPQAWRYLVDQRKRELEFMGLNDPQTLDRQLAAEQNAMLRKAYADRKSPAEYFYNMAVLRGWKTPEKPTPATAQSQVPAPTPSQLNQMMQGNGQGQPQQKPQPNPQGAQQIQNAQASMQANASLSGAGGAPGGGLTVSQLVNMSDDQFLDLAAKLGRKKLDALLSGSSF